LLAVDGVASSSPAISPQQASTHHPAAAVRGAATRAWQCFVSVRCVTRAGSRLRQTRIDVAPFDDAAFTQRSPCSCVRPRSARKILTNLFQRQACCNRRPAPVGQCLLRARCPRIEFSGWRKCINAVEAMWHRDLESRAATTGRARQSRLWTECRRRPLDLEVRTVHWLPNPFRVLGSRFGERPFVLRTDRAEALRRRTRSSLNRATPHTDGGADSLSVTKLSLRPSRFGSAALFARFPHAGIW
jgi:hypothetical protein